MINILKLIRVEQWTKNLLIFAVPILANQLELETFNKLIQIFFGFSLIASSGYILNDIQDLDSDRQHYLKSKRALASGKITVAQSKKIFTITTFLGTIVLFLNSPKILLMSLSYLVLSFAYSKYLKYLKYLDLAIISLFFVLRVHIGAVGSNIEVSVFLNLLIFFSSLAIVTSKKLSILTDKNIKNSKVKNSINKNYEVNLLKRVLVFSIVMTFIAFNMWIFLSKTVNLTFFASNFMFILFSRRFYILTLDSKTEDFIATLKNDKVLSFYIFIFILFTMYGIVF